MNNNKQKSFEELNKFIDENELQNDNSITHFHAYVSIKTSTLELNKEKMTVRVRYDVSPGIAELSLHDHNLNPKEYPEIFYPDYAIFKYIDNMFLDIEDTHNHNLKIGKYIIKIFPLGQVKS